MYMYVYTHIYVYICMHTCKRKNVYVTYIYICMYTCIYIYVYIFVYMYTYIHTCMYICAYRYVYPCIYVYIQTETFSWRQCKRHEVASSSRLLKSIGVFCKRATQKRQYSAKETCNFKEPTNRSHPTAFYCMLLACMYGVATISRMLKNIGLFCKRDLQKRPIFCKETYIFKHPTPRSHPIRVYTHVYVHICTYMYAYTYI